MANVTWIVDADGDWSNAADWSGGVLPGSTSNVTIDTTNTRTITHSVGNDFVHTLKVTNDQFSMTGGNLTILSSATFSDGLNQTGGSLLGSGKIAISGGATLLGGYAGGSLALTINGTIALANYTLGGSASLTNAAITDETGQVTIGDQTGLDAQIINQAKGVYNFGGDFGIGSGAASASLVNTGNLAKVAGAGTSLIGVTLNSTGTLTAATGTLELDAAGDAIGGTLAGAGQIAFAGGYAYALAAGTTATVAQIDLYSGGTTLTLGGALTYAGLLNETSGATISLGGATLTLSGNADLASTIDGGGTLVTTSQATVAGFTVAGGTSWSDSGAVTETGPVQIGDTISASELTIQKGGVYTLASNDGIVPGGNPASSLVIAGTLAKTYAGTSHISINATSTGTITAGAGATIDFNGPTETIGGALTGAGAVTFSGPNAVLASGVIASVATIGVSGYGAMLTLGGNLSYAGNFSENAPDATLNLAGHSLTLGGAATLSSNNVNYTAVVDGGGTLTTAGATGAYNISFGAGVNWINSGAVTSGGGLTLGDGSAGASLVNQAGGSFLLAANVGVTSGNSASIFTNAGTLANANAGTNTISVATTSTGTIDSVTGGAIDFSGAGNVLGGTLTGAGQIALTGGGTATILAGTTVSALFGVYNSAALTLKGNVTFAGGLDENGAGAAIDLNGHTLTTNSFSVVYQNYSNPYIGGPGTLDTTGLTAAYGFTLGGGAVWNNTGMLTQDNGANIDDDGTTINNQAGATYQFGGDYSLNRNGATTTQFNNAGTLAKIEGQGVSYVGANVASTGTIDVVGGEIELGGITNAVGGVVTGAGTIGFGSGGATTIAAGTTMSVAGVSITDNGTNVTLDGNLTVAGNLSQGSGSTVFLNAATLTLKGSNDFYSANYETPTIAGAGTLATTGATIINSLTLGGGATWQNSGAITLTGVMTIGDGAAEPSTLDNKAGASFIVQDSAYGPVISSGATVGSGIVNAGVFGKTGDSGAGGVSHVAVAITNTGSIEAFDDTLDLEGAVSGSGRMLIENGATLRLDGVVGGQSIKFGPGGGAVVLADAPQFGGSLANFASSDSIDLAGFAYNSTTETAAVSGGVLTVTDGSLVAKINLLIQFAAGFHLASDGGGGTLILAGPAPAEKPHLFTPHH